ncbi:hypothetical protein N7468_000931 [Penicillium chermesinum]|uniref:Uncharacterized protein n=1 Tax=Penicillium chermesinum TaxID=63820 RepID=A0A9W9TWV5_9EURO|nr:uncharacterized protein N7468_000931 [Penicillium chermesinum]KAJ5245948.1 hypothetical protein N7468_000931 [Penicillium chermesinum]KAJ6144244.1 hypothetical protein N7470_008139 [Penicillium chermesinum]
MSDKTFVPPKGFQDRAAADAAGKISQEKRKQNKQEAKVERDKAAAEAAGKSSQEKRTGNIYDMYKR